MPDPISDMKASCSASDTNKDEATNKEVNLSGVLKVTNLEKNLSIQTSSSQLSSNLEMSPLSHAQRQNAIRLLTANAKSHVFARHGGDVSNDTLMLRARTGSIENGKNHNIPYTSSAFYTDDLLIFADQKIRDSGAIEKLFTKEGNSSSLKVTVTQTFDIELGCGFNRINLESGKYNPDLEGPLQMITGMRSVIGVYQLNAKTNEWETITIMPTR